MKYLRWSLGHPKELLPQFGQLPPPPPLHGSFRGFAQSRAALLDVAATGPLVGTSAAAALTLVGFVLSSVGATDVSIDSVSFSDSFLMAVASQAFLGERLAQPVVEVRHYMDMFCAPSPHRWLSIVWESASFSDCIDCPWPETM